MPLAQTDISTAGFGAIDWTVVAAYLLLTTLVGAKLAGKQSTIRDFFLAGRKLPWWAICGSIIATEISAATFVAVPAISFAEGGNFTYLQLAIGSVIARVVIAVVFVPRFYQQEIYSPYDYIGRRLGPSAQRITTGLFFIGAVLGQGARLFICAAVLRVATGIDLVTSIWIIGAFSVVWALLGGMTTVIWTDVIQFTILAGGAVTALVFAVGAVPGGLGEVLGLARETGRLALLDFRAEPQLTYTFWCGLFAMPFLNLAALGTDQVMAQRMFCCRNQADARKAVLVSTVGIALAGLMLTVGLALYAYFRRHPFTAAEQAMYDANRNNLFPMFITSVLPTGVRGLVASAVFATAISTLDSTLAALAQTTSSILAGGGSGGRSSLQRRLTSGIGLSKVLIVAWGAVLCQVAVACITLQDRYANAVDLALGLSGYTYGPLLGVFLLALLAGRRADVGLIWSVPAGALAVFAVTVHADWATNAVRGVCLALLTLGFILWRTDLRRITAVVVGILAVLLLHEFKYQAAGDPTTHYLAFTWTYPIGTIMTFGLGYVLGRPARSGR